MNDVRDERGGKSQNAKPVRLPRVARGKRPQYFSDPATDKLLSMTLTLMEELSVTRDRLDTLERLLEDQRVVRRDAIESYRPDESAAAERSDRRVAYVDRVMRAAQAELEELTRRGPARADDDAVAAVES